MVTSGSGNNRRKEGDFYFSLYSHLYCFNTTAKHTLPLFKERKEREDEPLPANS